MTTTRERNPVEQQPTEDLPRPAPGPFLVIGGLLSFVIIGLGAAMWVGAAVSLPW